MHSEVVVEAEVTVVGVVVAGDRAGGHPLHRSAPLYLAAIRQPFFRNAATAHAFIRSGIVAIAVSSQYHG